MRILALDQASIITGWAIFDNGQLVKYGIIELNETDFGLRLNKLRDSLARLISDNYPIDKVYFEDIQLQNGNVDTFKKLAEVFGVVYELLTEIKMPNEAVLASVWKSKLSIGGKNRDAQKAGARDYVQRTFNIAPTQDACDAICIGEYANHVSKSTPDTFDWTD